MKKVKLSTALLVILAGTTVVPLISAAESVSETVKTEEVLTTEEPTKESEEVGTSESTPEEIDETEDGDTSDSSTEDTNTSESSSDDTSTSGSSTDNSSTSESSTEETTEETEDNEQTEEEILQEVKEAALEHVEYLKEIGFIGTVEYDRLINEINNATSVEKIDEILASVQFELEAVKNYAKELVQGFFDRGEIVEDEYLRVMIALDKAATIDEVYEILNSIKYDETFWRAKMAAFEEVEEAYLKGQITEEERDILYEELSAATSFEAINNILARLRAHIVNPTNILQTGNLSNAIAEAKLLNAANYTKESWANLAAALSSSEELLAATEVRMMNNITQAQIDQSTASLKAAMTQLVAVNPVAVITPGQVINTATTAAKTNQANLPETGEKENRLMALYGVMMSGLAGLFLVKKRKEEKEFL